MRGKNLAGALFLSALLASCGAEEARRVRSEDRIRELFVSQSNLLDPHSAQFRRLEYRISGSFEQWCGQVNAKNSLGAYVGWRQFYVSTGVENESGKRIGARLEVETAGFGVWNLLFETACEGLIEAPEILPGE